MELFYPNDSKLDLMGYAYACYLLYSHNVITNKIFIHMW